MLFGVIRASGFFIYEDIPLLSRKLHVYRVSKKTINTFRELTEVGCVCVREREREREKREKREREEGMEGRRQGGGRDGDLFICL